MIREKAVEQGATVFLTTHSPVVVDLFAEDHQAQVIHVTHDGRNAKATPVLSYSGRRGILDNLDVRASDLLQSNAVVWLEGPTDRMYFNAWIRLWTDSGLREGKDYQCVFYGGRLLNHLSAEEPEDIQREAIEILRVNRNAIVLIDSDKRYLRAPINSTKRRLIEEIEEGNGLAWVTKGREVEQYVPHAAFTAHFDREVPSLGLYGDVLDYLNGIEDKPGRKSFNKIKLAEAIIPNLTREMMAKHLDLGSNLERVCERLRQWNRKPAPPPRQVNE